jgi:protein-S-isoprenylcysteine O-methyltransferase Ste14
MFYLLPYILLAGSLWFWRKPDRQQSGAVLLAAIWNLPSILLLKIVAEHYDLWHLKIEDELSLPVLLLRWMLHWGLIPALALPALRPSLLMVVMLSFDLLFQQTLFPELEPGFNWVIGEVAGLLLCFLPAQLFARWTREDRCLSGRLILHFVYYSALMLGVLPAAIIEYGGGSWQPLFERSGWLNNLYLQLLSMPGILILSAVQEFAQRGHGTPMPYDPPKRLITSGVYAYVANPMQLSKFLLLTGWGLMLANPLVVCAGFTILIYSTTIAARREERDMVGRFGQDWIDYRKAIWRWLPRLRPYWPSTEPRALLYYDEICDPCRHLVLWLQRQRPLGLEIIAAQDHPTRDLIRVTYASSDGRVEEEGISAIALALGHIHLGWAFIGWSIRLPLICQLSQLIADAVSGGPRQVCRRVTVPSDSGAHKHTREISAV